MKNSFCQSDSLSVKSSWHHNRTSIPNLHLLFLLFFILPLQEGTSAPSSGSDTIHTASTEDIEYLDYLLDMVVTSGSFLELSPENSPASITTITKEDIRLSGARHLSELLEIYVPGFQYFYNKWNGTLWGMRGVTNDRNTKIIFCINGHKLNTQARDGFQAETVLGLMDDIERVEVLRGPAGLVYGSGAIAGIINVVTKKQSENGSSISCRSGLDGGAQQADLFYSASTGKNGTFSFSAGFRRDDGIGAQKSRIYGSGSHYYSLPPDWNETGVPSDGSFGKTDGNWRIAGDLTVNDFNLYCRLTRQMESAGGFFIFDPWPEIPDRPDSSSTDRMIDGTVVSPENPFWSSAGNSRASRLLYISENALLRARHSTMIDVNKIEYSVSLDLNTTRTAIEKRPGYETDYNLRDMGYVDNSFGEKRISLNSVFHLNSVNRLQLATGMEYRLDMIGEDMEGRNGFTEYPRRLQVADINYHTISLFSEGLYNLNDLFDIHLGGRLDLHTRAIMVNPKAALLFHFNEKHSFKLIFQSASNNGSADNYEHNRFHYNNDGMLLEPTPSLGIFDNTQPAPPIDTLHSLDPEKVYTAEFVYTGTPLSGFSVTPSLSVGRVSNLFGWTEKLFRVVNAGNYNYLNFDIEVTLKRDLFSIGGAHTFQRPIMTNPEKEYRTYQIYSYRYKVVPDSTSPEDSIPRYIPVLTSSVSDYDVNIIKSSVTTDGTDFLNLNTNTTKLYCTVKPCDWLTLHTNIRLFWGLAGRDSIYSTNDDINYWHISDGFKELSLYDYLRKGVSKKVNASIHFSLPNDFQIALLAYNLLGIDRPTDKNTRNNVINTLRWQQMHEHERDELYSTDQRAFHLQLTKRF